MPLVRKKGLFESNRVLFLPVSTISPNPGQPRKCFSQEGLEELAASIREHGVLQPLSVRKAAGGYELISGERRLRAARMAGLQEVPCIVVSVDSEGSSLLALVENLQRRDLDFVEEAAALAKLIRTYDLSQEEAARRIGKSQSAVANKLRLLRLSPQVLTLLREYGCTERHARALLRLEGEDRQLAAARHVVEHRLTVAKTEQYIDQLLARAERAKKRKPVILVKDVRFFLNTVTKGLNLMKTAGVDAACARQRHQGAESDENCRGGRRLRPPGHGGRHSSHHPHSQTGRRLVLSFTAMFHVKHRRIFSVRVEMRTAPHYNRNCPFWNWKKGRCGYGQDHCNCESKGRCGQDHHLCQPGGGAEKPGLPGSGV